MARGDLFVFDEGKLALFNEGWLGADEIWVGITSDTPVITDPIPAYAAGGTTNYTAIATAGGYSVGGELLNTITLMYAEAAGTVTFDDTDPSVSWTQNPASPVDGEYALIYHKSSGLCIAFIDLDGPIVMTAGDLTITWDALGIFTVA